MSDAATTPPQHPDIHLNELDAEIQDTTNNSPQSVHEAASPSSGENTKTSFMTHQVFKVNASRLCFVVASGPSVAREPPRKRQRTQEYSESQVGPSSSNSSPVNSVHDMSPSAKEADTINNTDEVVVQWVRDDKFYFPTGDCVLRVDNILFKVRDSLR